MQIIQSRWLRNSGWIALCLLILIPFVCAGCSNNDLQKQVDALTQEKTALQATVQTITQDNTALQNQVETLTQENNSLKQGFLQNHTSLSVDKLDTASSVTSTNGQIDWRNYTQKDTFASGYSGEFLVMFSFSNALHNKTVNVKGDIYIVSNGVLIDSKNKDVNQTTATNNTLFWGDNFDISKYADGDYMVVINLTDLISGTSTSATNTFKIGGSN